MKGPIPDMNNPSPLVAAIRAKREAACVDQKLQPGIYVGLNKSGMRHRCDEIEKQIEIEIRMQWPILHRPPSSTPS